MFFALYEVNITLLSITPAVNKYNDKRVAPSSRVPFINILTEQLLLYAALYEAKTLVLALYVVKIAH